MPTQPVLSRRLRISAYVIFAVAMLLGAIGALNLAMMPLKPGEEILDRLPRVIGIVGVSLALVVGAVILYVQSIIIIRPQEQAPAPTPSPEPAPREPSTRSGDNRLVLEAIAALKRSTDQLAARPIAAMQTPPTEPPVQGGRTAMALQEILSLLRELRDLTLLGDEQRRQRIENMRRQRRDDFVADTTRMVQNAQWAAASRAIADFERDFGNELDLGDLKRRLIQGQSAAEARELAELRPRIDDLTAVSSWDQAHDLAARFVENFPKNPDGQELLARVQHDREIYVETTANRLYEEIKADIERRRWRRALGNARRLLERFSGHRRCATVRAQLKTIEENAEIEQRHEQEHQIQDMIRNRQFAAAIESAEDLIERFPHSPQAETLRQLLPKLRDFVRQEMESHADGAGESAA